jgi:hypothetical protein
VSGRLARPAGPLAQRRPRLWAGDRFLAVQDGADRRAADQVGQAADHAAGALVQVTGLM